MKLGAQPPSPLLGDSDDGDDGQRRLHLRFDSADERAAQQARQRAVQQLRIDNYRSISTRPHSRAAAAQAQQIALALALLQGFTQADDDVEEVKKETLTGMERAAAAASAESSSEQRSRMADLIARQRYANPEVQLSSLCKLPLIPAMLVSRYLPDASSRAASLAL